MSNIPPARHPLAALRADLNAHFGWVSRHEWRAIWGGFWGAGGVRNRGTVKRLFGAGVGGLVEAA